MAFTIEHQFDGATYTVVGDAGELRIVGPDRPGVLIHFVKTLNDCLIQIAGLHRSQGANGEFVLDIQFQVEEEDDLNLLIQELNQRA